MSTSWPRVAWALVHPGDQVYGADQHVWDVVERDGRLVVIARQDGDRERRVSRISPAGDVPCQRGQAWLDIVAAVGVFRDAGFTVDHRGTWPLAGVDAIEPAG